MTNWYAIWCKDREDWLRESSADGIGVIAFPTKKAAMRRAALEYASYSYTEAKRNGWVEVRPLGDKL